MDQNSKDRFRRWYAANRDRIRAASRERYRTNAEYRASVLAQRQALYATKRDTALPAARERYASDPEYRAKCLAQTKASRMRNPEAYRAQSRRRLENPRYREANRLRAAVWKQAHPEQAKAKVAQWKTNHPDYAWWKVNPEGWKAIVRRRRAAKLRLPNESIRLSDIAERDGWRCHLCGKRVTKQNASMYHLIPLSKGGPHLKVNVALAHLICNKRRGAGRIPAQLRLS